MKQVDTKSIIDRHGTTWPNGYEKEKENKKVVYIECSDYRNVRTGHGYEEKCLKEKGGSQK